MRIKKIVLFIVCFTFGFEVCAQSILPQYEKPSAEFLKLSPKTIGVSYFACGETAKSYEAKLSKENCLLIEKGGGKFVETSDINHNGVMETMKVGRFKDSDGGIGTFLEIIEGKTRTIFRSENYQEFSFISHLNGEVIWAWCFSCGNFYPISWKGDRFIDYSPFNE